MQTKQQALDRASSVLKRLFKDFNDIGLISVYLWGSIITPDFNLATSDIDAVGILDDSADFTEMSKIREWLPTVDPGLKRLQINFFYLSELMNTKPVRGNLARLHHAEQAVFDFPFWHFVCGRRFSDDDFPEVSAAQVIHHQIELVKTKRQWALAPDRYYGDISLQYFCKGLVWLCWSIHRQTYPPRPFSWQDLVAESNQDTKELVKKLAELKRTGWDKQAIRTGLPELLDISYALVAKYK